MQKQKISQTKQLLRVIGENARYTAIDLVDLFAAFLNPVDFAELARGGGIDGVRAKRRRRFEYEQRQVLVRLEQQRCITIRRAADRVSIALTKKGAAIVQKEKIRSARHCPLGQGVLVTFDIPERVRNLRDQFRLFLKECNFQKVEQSVWFTPCDAYDELRDFIRESNSEKWIHVFRVIHAFINDNTKSSRS